MNSKVNSLLTDWSNLPVLATIKLERRVYLAKFLFFNCLIWFFFYLYDIVLTYRHELGMNYNFIRPDLIVGSCLQVIIVFDIFFFNLYIIKHHPPHYLFHSDSTKCQTPEDVDKLRSIGVKTIFCLQQDPDLEYPNSINI